MLQRGCYVVGVASLYSIPWGPQYAGNDAPEIEIFGHVHLLEHVQEPVFFRNPFYAVIVADWKDFGALTMIYVVSA